jgi:hypothetical protein
VGTPVRGHAQSRRRLLLPPPHPLSFPAGLSPAPLHCRSPTAVPPPSFSLCPVFPAVFPSVVPLRLSPRYLPPVFPHCCLRHPFLFFAVLLTRLFFCVCLGGVSSKRAQEMLKTAELSLAQTKLNAGKHFLGDFLPKDQVRCDHSAQLTSTPPPLPPPAMLGWHTASSFGFGGAPCPG